MRNRTLWKKKLERAERAGNFLHGYKLVFGPWKSLKGLDTVFLSLMPSLPVPKDADWRAISEERGNTFEIELDVADSPYNFQFLELAEFIGKKPQKILTGVATPFRVMRWSDLNEQQQTITWQLGAKFWEAPLKQELVKLIIVCGQETCNLVREITDAEAELNTPPEMEIAANWGNINLRRYHTKHGKVIVHLPGLAQYSLFSREQCREPLEQIFQGFVNP